VKRPSLPRLVEGKPQPDTLILAERKQRIEEVLDQRTRTLTVVLDQLEDPFNMAAVLRSAEGMGLQEVHVIRNKQHPWNPNAKVTQGCDKWLDLCEYPDFGACRAALKQRGFAIWASALQEGATSLFDLRFDSRIALVFGNERFGVSPEVLGGADGVFWIPMRGFTQSLNVSAAAISSVTQAVAWRLRHGGPMGDLSGGERTALRERFHYLSVKQRGRLYGSKKIDASPE
jgi:tRNA (guanosine-2'-O-)-methyltransferase